MFSFFTSGKACGLLSLLLLFVLPIPLPGHNQQPQQESYVAGSSLTIRVAGNHLVNSNGQTVQLRGVNVSGGGNCVPILQQPPGILYPLTQTSEAKTISGIVNWNVNVVRVTMNEDCWLNINGPLAYSGSTYINGIVDFINLLHTHGIYVDVDLHTNGPGTYVANSQQVMADEDHAIAYWKSVATTFKNDPAVMFEAYNEPHIDATNTTSKTTNYWDCWKNGCTITETDQNQNQPVPGAPYWQSAGMQSLVDAIRSTGATNPILLGGLNWCQDLTQFLQYLPSDPQHQLVAAYHNYMSSTSKNTKAYWNSVIAPIAQQMPVITTEMGEKDGGSTYNTEYLTWADTYGVSYIPWAWGTSDAYGPLALLSNWDGSPSIYGQTFYNHFHSL